ncbi:hypothetical protein MHBO_000268 [Bonamia ostreae]|uniref:Uncharacterized protein n=1 Tax=Bonamia ostreae TaxID=126728 RepID=A0ABV2AF15_9EUKA
MDYLHPQNEKHFKLQTFILRLFHPLLRLPSLRFGTASTQNFHSCRGRSSGARRSLFPRGCPRSPSSVLPTLSTSFPL